MILFDDDVEVFDLTNRDARLSFGIVAFEGSGVGATLVDRDLLGLVHSPAGADLVLACSKLPIQ
jgi:hypothetical protein